MDDVDVTAERDEREAPARMAASKKPSGPPATGFCNHCDDPVVFSMRWCDTECRDAWQAEQRRHRAG